MLKRARIACGVFLACAALQASATDSKKQVDDHPKLGRLSRDFGYPALPVAGSSVPLFRLKMVVQ